MINLARTWAPPFSAGLFAVISTAALLQDCAAGLDPGLMSYQPAPVAFPTDAKYVLPDGTVQIAGAEHTQFMMEQFNQLFTESHPGFKFTLNLKGTTMGMPDLTYGVTLFAPLGREVSPIELVPFGKIVGQPPLEIRVAHDSNTPGKFATSLAIYVNRENPLQKLTMTQVSQIFTRGNRDGDYSTWSQLGANGKWAKLAIHPYGTPRSSGFGDYMQKYFFAGRPFAAAYEQFANTDEIMHRVADDPAGIGFAAIGLKDPQIKIIALSADNDTYSTGSPDDITANRYPMGRFLYFYIRRAPGQPVDPVVKEYFRLILSKQGQEIIGSEAHGYMPLTAAETAAELAKL